MSRSVWTHSDAIETVFYPLDFDEDDLSWGLWEGHLDDIREAFKRKFPSMLDCDYWPEEESHAIVENEHCMVVISEYGGLISLGVVARIADDMKAANYDFSNHFAAHWTETNVAPFLRERYGELRKIGTASNGESFYERIQT